MTTAVPIVTIAEDASAIENGPAARVCASTGGEGMPAELEASIARLLTAVCHCSHREEMAATMETINRTTQAALQAAVRGWQQTHPT
jgi:hypothetical protein